MKEPKLKYKISMNDLKKVLNIPTPRGQFKKGDIVELIDEELGINKKCRIKRVMNMDNNPHYWKVHNLESMFEMIELETNFKKE